MTKPKKINYIYLTKKSTDWDTDKVACGWCFAVLDNDDDFCWSCGVELGKDGESFLDSLIESLKMKQLEKEV